MIKMHIKFTDKLLKSVGEELYMHSDMVPEVFRMQK